MLDLFRPQHTFNSILFLLFIELASASRNVFPKPTLAGLRAAEHELQILPTPNPWSSPELLRRFAGDPAICGWVEGDASKLFWLKIEVLSVSLTVGFVKVMQSLVTRVILVGQPRPMLAAAQRPD